MDILFDSNQVNSNAKSYFLIGGTLVALGAAFVTSGFLLHHGRVALRDSTCTAAPGIPKWMLASGGIYVCLFVGFCLNLIQDLENGGDSDYKKASARHAHSIMTMVMIALSIAGWATIRTCKECKLEYTVPISIPTDNPIVADNSIDEVNTLILADNQILVNSTVDFFAIQDMLDWHGDMLEYITGITSSSITSILGSNFTIPQISDIERLFDLFVLDIENDVQNMSINGPIGSGVTNQLISCNTRLSSDLSRSMRERCEEVHRIFCDNHEDTNKTLEGVAWDERQAYLIVLAHAGHSV